LRRYARSLGLDLIGFCSTNKFEDAPRERRPEVYLEDAKSIISIGYKLNFTSIQNLPASRSAYMLEHDYANLHLNQSSHKMVRFLEEKGFNAVGFDAGAGFYLEAGKDPQMFAGDFSHKHAAVACGLGKFGLNNLVITKKFGPRVRFTTIITNAELRYDAPLRENPCLTYECKECINVCPVNALDGWEGKYNPETGWLIDKKKCYEYIFKTLKGKRCGLCIKACPVGLDG